MAQATISNIEKITIKADDDITAVVNGTNITGLKSISTTQSVDSSITAGTTTDISISGAAGAITATGGKDVSITAAGTTVGSTKAAGTVSVTDAGKAAAVTTIVVENGTDVTVNATTDTTGTIKVGDTTATHAAAKAATGDVVVNSTILAKDGVATNAGSTIGVDGGKTITVNQMVTADEDALADITGQTITQGKVTITGQNATTAVTVNQETSVAKVGATAAADKEIATSVVTFKKLDATENVVVNGLKFTASVDLTAEQVAQAFANLEWKETQENGGVVANGYYKDANGAAVSTNWTTGAATGATVTYTTTDTTNTIAKPVVTGANATAADYTKSVASTTAAKEGITGIINGVVDIQDGGTASIKTVSVDGYAGSSVITSTVLDTLSLANSGGTNAGDKNATLTVTTGVTALDATLNNINGDITLVDANLTTLNVTTAGKDSTFVLAGSAIGVISALNVGGTNSLDLSTTDITSLKTVTVKDSAGLTIDAKSATALTVDTTATTGTVKATVNATQATYKGGAGVDNLILDTATTITKAIDLGDGDDTLTLVASTSAATAAVKGGAGTDTLSMTAATTQTLSMANISGFERLFINDAPTLAADLTVDLETLGFNYVTTSGIAGGAFELILDKMANKGTVVLTAAQTVGTHTVNVVDADTLATTLNIITTVAQADVDAGTITVANVTDINITARDTDLDHDGKGDSVDRDLSELDLVATSAKTITIDGEANLTLDNSANVKATMINASAMTGNLSVATVATATAATTIKGGSGNDTLIATDSTNGIFVDILNGGAGDDILISTAKTQMTGGAGNDLFIAGHASEVNGFSQIKDLSSGDKIGMLFDNTNYVAGTTVSEIASFTKLTEGNTPDQVLDPSANLITFANAAVKQNTADAGAVWFTYANNTYIVMEGTGATGDDYVTAEDNIVMIAGTNIDLSTGASFNATTGIIEIA